MKRVLITLLVFFMLINVTSISANEKSKYIDSDLGYICNVVDGGTINIDGEENSLFVVFESQENALEEYKTIYADFISILKELYSLEDMSEANYKDYLASYLDYSDNNEEAFCLKGQN